MKKNSPHDLAFQYDFKLDTTRNDWILFITKKKKLVIKKENKYLVAYTNNSYNKKIKAISFHVLMEKIQEWIK